MNKDSIPIAGGRANLGEMFNIGLPLPPGFVIRAPTYKQFIERTKIKVKIEKLLEGLDVKRISLQATAKKIQKLILPPHSKDIPKNLRIIMLRWEMCL